MNTIPRRTHATALTDNELLLLDVLFDTPLAFWQLERKHFGEVHNTYRVPSLISRALRKTLDRWRQEGVICQGSWDDGDTYYAITAIGGALWESERTPNWSRYASLSGDLPESREEFALLSVCSPSKTVGRRYIERRCRRGGGPVDLTSLRSFRRRGSLPYLPWKRFPCFVEWQIRATDYDFFGIPNPAWDWDQEEKARIWWTDVDQLQRFLAP